MTLSEHITLLVNYRDNLLITLAADIYLLAVDQNKQPMPQKALVQMSLSVVMKILEEIQLCNEHIARYTAWEKWNSDHTANPDLFKTADQYITKG